jgi:hypothetical protein
VEEGGNIGVEAVVEGNEAAFNIGDAYCDFFCMGLIELELGRRGGDWTDDEARAEVVLVVGVASTAAALVVVAVVEDAATVVDGWVWAGTRNLIFAWDGFAYSGRAYGSGRSDMSWRKVS